MLYAYASGTQLVGNVGASRSRVQSSGCLYVAKRVLARGCARVFIDDDILDSSSFFPLSCPPSSPPSLSLSLFSGARRCCFVAVAVAVAVIVIVVVDVARPALPTERPRRGPLLRFSSFPTCYHLVNHRQPSAAAPVVPIMRARQFHSHAFGKKVVPARGGRNGGSPDRGQDEGEEKATVLL